MSNKKQDKLIGNLIHYHKIFKYELNQILKEGSLLYKIMVKNQNTIIYISMVFYNNQQI